MLKFIVGLAMLVVIFPASSKAQSAILSRLALDSCQAQLEADVRWQVLTVKISPLGCPLTRDQLLSLFRRAISGNDSLLQRHRFNSIFLGRVIDYPWLSDFLIRQALRDSAWSKKQGRPRRQNINTYVARLAGKHPFIEKLNSVLANIHYKITGVSVEKVLVGRYRQLHDYTGPEFKGGAPFDAQIYLLLQPLK